MEITGGWILNQEKNKLQTDSGLDEESERRQTFRYFFKEGDGPKIQFKGKDIIVLDISAGGIQFKNKGFTLLETGSVQFDLDFSNDKGDTNFKADLRILEIDENNICHCLFENCTLEYHELVYKYVMTKQETDFKEEKNDLSP